MSINFAGESSGGHSHLTNAQISFLDRRFINTDEKIPELKIVKDRLKDLERSRHQAQINIEDMRMKIARQKEEQKEEIETFRSAIRTLIIANTQKIANLDDFMLRSSTLHERLSSHSQQQSQI